jgi:hypothetical protein
MEQSSGKKERLMLAAGLAAALALAAAQYFFPVSRAVTAGRDVNLAVLGERGAALLAYHPGPGTVDAFTASDLKQRAGVSGRQRALELLSLAGGATAQAEVFFVQVSSAPDLDVLRGALNGWRAEPRRFFAAASWVGGLRAAGATDIPAFDLFRLFSDLSRLGFSNFSTTELTRQARKPEAGAPERTGPTPRVEVFNASGRKDLAALAARKLRGLGFDVITAASYHKKEKHTRVLGFSGDTSAALRLRSALGLDALEVRRSPQRSVAGAAVILGEDFDGTGLGK